ncbi:MAG: FkbM family methyltransferase [Vicinamibacterales bacterium]
MKFLLVARQKKNVDTFHGVMSRLLADGHAVTLAIQERMDEDARRALAGRFPAAGFALVTPPEGRGDQWRASVPLVRAARDWAQYLRPAYRHASKLRRRAIHRFVKEAGIGEAFDPELAISQPHADRLREALEQIEHAVPSDPLHEEFIRRHAPDVVLVTPGLHFGSAQADFIKSARACGVPVWMLLFSWDNLSTKGVLPVAPDRMFVWNEQQRREAVELHDYPADRVVVAGAPRFDEFFTLTSVMGYGDFLKPLDLDPAAPTLLYVCSSRFIAADELSFLRRWLAALRASPNTTLRGCNVIVRPHPDQVLVEGEEPSARTWPSMPQATGWVQRPFADPRAVVLRTTYGTPQAFFECLHHASAVVGLNTSAELEAGIVGRPVFTVLADGEGADGQSHTLHFNYLLRDHGGFVEYAPDLATHTAQLAAALQRPPDAGGIHRFIRGFLRPVGDEPVADVLARMLMTTSIERAAPAPETATPTSDDVRPAVRDGRTLTLGYPGSTARVAATDETRGHRRHGVLVLDSTAVAWLDEFVAPGDVLYDIGAGIGAYSLAAALHRGALVVAFEPGFTAFKRLCDNLLANGCYRSVVPLPIALGAAPGLQDLEYAGDAGGLAHALTGRRWKARGDATEARYTQPVCSERLDDLVSRHRLPPPNAIRVSLRGGAAAALQGAEALLRQPQLRAVLASVSSAREAARVVEAVGGDYAAEDMPGPGSDRHVLLRRRGEGAVRGAARLWQRMTGTGAR